TRRPIENPAIRVLRESHVVRLGDHTLLLAKDGTERPVEDTAAPIKDQEGKIIGVVLVLRDVTERRTLDEALRRSEERYRSLTAVTTSVVWTTDATGAFVSPQPSWEAYTGQAWDGHAPEGWLHGMHPDDREPMQAVWGRALAERTTFQAEGRVHAASGQYRHCIIHAVPLLDSNGTVREWVGTLTDVDDHKRAEEQASARVRQLKVIASLGEMALSGRDLQSLMDEAATYVSQALGSDMAEVLELTPEGSHLTLRAGTGWKPGRVGHATVAVEPEPLKRYTLASPTPVVIDDLRTETRFSGSQLLLEHGVVSGVSVVIA